MTLIGIPVVEKSEMCQKSIPKINNRDTKAWPVLDMIAMTANYDLTVTSQKKQTQMESEAAVATFKVDF